MPRSGGDYMYGRRHYGPFPTGREARMVADEPKEVTPEARVVTVHMVALKSKQEEDKESKAAGYLTYLFPVEVSFYLGGDCETRSTTMSDVEFIHFADTFHKLAGLVDGFEVKVESL